MYGLLERKWEICAKDIFCRKTRCVFF